MVEASRCARLTLILAVAAALITAACSGGTKSATVAAATSTATTATSPKSSDASTPGSASVTGSGAGDAAALCSFLGSEVTSLKSRDPGSMIARSNDFAVDSLQWVIDHRGKAAAGDNYPKYLDDTAGPACPQARAAVLALVGAGTTFVDHLTYGT